MSAAVEPTVPAHPIHTISLFVNNVPGVLVRVSLVFSRRGFNIESMVVSPGAEGRFSRMTVTCSGEPVVLEQIIKQLSKLVDVVHALDHSTDDSYEVEIALVKIECSIEERAQILQIAEHFKARAVDYGSDSVILQANGSSEKVDAMIMLLRPYGIVELVRSGKLLMARGKRTT
ncbi:MAG: acetolactate synthase small subunit [Myxococcota bacterium]